MSSPSDLQRAARRGGEGGSQGDWETGKKGCWKNKNEAFERLEEKMQRCQWDSLCALPQILSPLIPIWCTRVQLINTFVSFFIRSVSQHMLTVVNRLGRHTVVECN